MTARESADVIHRMVREARKEAYEQSFMERLRGEAGWAIGN